MWQKVITTHKGITQVNKTKFDLLNSQHDSSYMLESESIDDMITRFTTITNELVSLGKFIDNDQKV